MSFFKKIKDVFQQLFFSQNPEVKAKLEFKKYENELKEIKPEIYKNTYATPLVGKAFYILYKETLHIGQILSQTICSSDLATANHYTDLLLKTGYKGEALVKLNHLSYEEMRDIVMETSNKKVAREKLKIDLDDVIKATHDDEFRKIENILCQLDRLYEICNFHAIDVVNMFCPDFNPNSFNPNPTFNSVEANKLEKYFLDLLFLTGNYEITAGQGRALIALNQLLTGKFEDDIAAEKILTSLRKIAAVLNRTLNKNNMVLYLRVIKQTGNISIQEAAFNTNKLSNYMTRLSRQFTTTFDRIEAELQDQQISEDTDQLFEDKPLVEVEHYNLENSNYFVAVGFPSFLWITPMKILKSFVHYFYSEPIQTLLNDIVVEGFFNNPDYKTEFAQKVFEATETAGRIKEFEDSFEKGGIHDISVLKSYAREYNANQDLGKKLSISIESANAAANKLLKNECMVLKQMQGLLKSLLEEAHKVSATNITNIKLLFNSSRNKEKVVLLENQFSKWQFFINIMKNYVPLTNIVENQK